MDVFFAQLQLRWLKPDIYAPIFLTCYCFLTFSCTQNTDKKHATVNPSHKNEIATITPLPFGPKINLDSLPTAGNFYGRLIYKDVGQLISDEGWTAQSLKNIKFYQLPPIKIIKYIKIPGVDIDRSCNGTPWGKLLKLNHYRYRLPDFNKCECYYICDYAPAGKEYTADARQNYQSCLYNIFYGYLIIYNRQTAEASVIPIFYDTYEDGLDFTRHFYIDKDFNIFLVDFSQESDDGDGSVAAPIIINNKHKISISKKGEIVITKI